MTLLSPFAEGQKVHLTDITKQLVFLKNRFHTSKRTQSNKIDGNTRHNDWLHYNKGVKRHPFVLSDGLAFCFAKFTLNLQKSMLFSNCAKDTQMSDNIVDKGIFHQNGHFCPFRISFAPAAHLKM